MSRGCFCPRFTMELWSTSPKSSATLPHDTPVDGIHLDYIRFPNDEFDYSAETLEEFRTDIQSRLSGAERRDYAARAHWTPPVLHGDVPPAMAGIPPRAADVAVDEDSRDGQIQTTGRDAERCRVSGRDRGDNQALSGMGSTGWNPDCSMRSARWPTRPIRGLFRAQIANVEQLAGQRRVWAGIGAYQLSPSATVEQHSDREAAWCRGHRSVFLRQSEQHLR